jgi:DNA primase
VPGYLGSRGLAVGLEETWSIGYAPGRWTALVDHLRGLGADDDILLASGLATKARTGRPVDRFRDRLMIPLGDPAGDVIGFVGRAGPSTDDDRAPRYLNSPETALYRKSDMLYGLADGRTALDRGARPVLVEGPLDAIAVTAGTEGRCVGVAACGTAVTAAHIDLLIRHGDVRTRGLVVATDNDVAGHAAAASLLPQLCKRGITATAADLPEGLDPTDVLLRHGPADLTSALLDRARPLADVVIDQRLTAWSGRLRWVEGRVGAVRDVAHLIAALPGNEIGRAVGRVADRAGVDVTTVQREVAAWIGIHDRRPAGPAGFAARSGLPAVATPPCRPDSVNPAPPRLSR